MYYSACRMAVFCDGWAAAMTDRKLRIVIVEPVYQSTHFERRPGGAGVEMAAHVRVVALLDEPDAERSQQVHQVVDGRRVVVDAQQHQRLSQEYWPIDGGRRVQLRVHVVVSGQVARPRVLADAGVARVRPAVVEQVLERRRRRRWRAAAGPVRVRAPCPAGRRRRVVVLVLGKQLPAGGSVLAVQGQVDGARQETEDAEQDDVTSGEDSRRRRRRRSDAAAATATAGADAASYSAPGVHDWMVQQL